MKKITMSAVALTAIMGAFGGASADDGINILDDLVVNGQIRPRYEYADVKDNTNPAANAFTARVKLNASAKLFGVDGLSANLGVISVSNFGSHKYNWNGTNYTDGGGNKYELVVDPQTAMISNADVNYKIDKTTLHAGRSQVNLDNQRFIGTVGWRQFERSYDTVYVSNSSIENLSLLAAWVYGLQGVKENPTQDANTVLLHASYDAMPELKVTAYGYLIAAQNMSAPGTGGFGSDTYGMALSGKVDAGMKLTYRAEYAVQKDATMKYQETTANSSAFKADASYYNLDLGANISGILLGANYEFLSGKDINEPAGGKTAFNPVLGTNHKFNGWADMFYVSQNPDGGLKDLNVRAGYKAKGFGKLLAVYHDFKADKAMAVASGTGTTDDLGSEFDIVYANAIPGFKNLKGLVKYASYSKGKAKNSSNTKSWDHDKQVAWVQLDYKFSTK